MCKKEIVDLIFALYCRLDDFIDTTYTALLLSTAGDYAGLGWVPHRSSKEESLVTAQC